MSCSGPLSIKGIAELSHCQQPQHLHWCKCFQTALSLALAYLYLPNCNWALLKSTWSLWRTHTLQFSANTLTLIFPSFTVCLDSNRTEHVTGLCSLVHARTSLEAFSLSYWWTLYLHHDPFFHSVIRLLMTKESVWRVESPGQNPHVNIFC